MKVQFTAEERGHMLELLPVLEETVAQIALKELRPEDAKGLFDEGENQFREILNAKLATSTKETKQRHLERLRQGGLSSANGERMLRAMLAFFSEATDTPTRALTREELDMWKG
jgi:hypothetical protein